MKIHHPLYAAFCALLGGVLIGAGVASSTTWLWTSGIAAVVGGLVGATGLATWFISGGRHWE